MSKTPRHISFDEVRKIISNTPGQEHCHPFISDELSVVYDSSFVFRNALELNVPYIIEDVRMLVVMEGEADVRVNLMEQHIEKGMIVFMGCGSILQPIRVSDDMNVRGFMMQRGLAERVMSNQFASAYLAEDQTRCVVAERASVELLIDMHAVLWRLVKIEGYREEVVVPLLMAFSNYFVDLMEKEHQRATMSVTHSSRVFKLFISLVNKHSATQHSLSFYANELCLSAHHLGLVVKAESGVTAKEWIDRAIIMQAKMLLKGGDMQAAEVSGRLNFSNPSFFSKYFKRITGMTPQEYKQS